MFGSMRTRFASISKLLALLSFLATLLSVPIFANSAANADPTFSCSPTHLDLCNAQNCKSSGGIAWVTNDKNHPSYCAFAEMCSPSSLNLCDSYSCPIVGGQWYLGDRGSSQGTCLFSGDSTYTPPPSDTTGGQTFTGSPDSVVGNCDKDGNNCTIKNCDQDENCKKITSTLVAATNLLSALVGIIAVAMIVFGGIQFSTSGGDPQKVASGKKHITNAIIALVAFVFLWAFLNFLIPGGLFNG